MLLELPFVKTLSPLYVEGDSNSVLFRYLMVDLKDTFPRPIVCNTCFVPQLSGASIMENGGLNPAIVEYFRREMIVDVTERASFHDNNNRSIHHRMWQHSIMPPLHDVYGFEGPPPILLLVGSIDLAYLLRELGTDADFRLSDPYFVDSAFGVTKLSSVPYGPVLDLIRRRLRPIGEALRELAAIGFGEVYVHSIHPPTPDDIRYYRIRHVMSTAKIRYKVAIVMNRVLAELSRENGARFLDLWPFMLAGGSIDPALVLDGDHLNRNSADLTLRSLLSDIVVRRGQFM